MHVMRDEYKKTLSSNEHFARLRLARSRGIGPILFHSLLQRFGSAENALQAIPDLTRKNGGRRVSLCAPHKAEDELARWEAAGATLIGVGDAAYPLALAHIPDPPPFFGAIGRLDLLEKTGIGIVGARNASANGCLVAETLARDLGAHQIIVVSGLARGIDTAAHRGALKTGTVAVLGGGIDVVYPRQNRGLYEAIAADGVLVSEMPPGTQPMARHFPRRNRIISGLAVGVVVVEAAPRSGSLITARQALEQGRDVFAVPGSALDPRSRGTNELIRQGAVLTETVDDVLRELPQAFRPQPNPTAVPPPASPSPSAQLAPKSAPSPRHVSVPAPEFVEPEGLGRELRSILGPVPTPIDDVIRQLGVPAATLSTALMELELAGRLLRHPGNMISIPPGT